MPTLPARVPPSSLVYTGAGSGPSENGQAALIAAGGTATFPFLDAGASSGLALAQWESDEILTARGRCSASNVPCDAAYIIPSDAEYQRAYDASTATQTPIASGAWTAYASMTTSEVVGGLWRFVTGSAGGAIGTANCAANPEFWATHLSARVNAKAGGYGWQLLIYAPYSLRNNASLTCYGSAYGASEGKVEFSGVLLPITAGAGEMVDIYLFFRKDPAANAPQRTVQGICRKRGSYARGTMDGMIPFSVSVVGATVGAAAIYMTSPGSGDNSVDMMRCYGGSEWQTLANPDTTLSPNRQWWQIEFTNATSNTATLTDADFMSDATVVGALANPVGGGNSSGIWAKADTLASGYSRLFRVTNTANDYEVELELPFTGFFFTDLPDDDYNLVMLDIPPGGMEGTPCAAIGPITLPPAPSPTVDTFTADQTATVSGDPVLLSWTTTAATTSRTLFVTVISTGAITALACAEDGSVTVNPVEPTLYQLQAIGPGGTVYSTPRAVVASPASAYSPIGTLLALATTIQAGRTVTLIPVFSGGTGSIDQGIGPVVSGVPIVRSPAGTTTYTLTVEDGVAPVGYPVTVTVTPVVAPVSGAIPRCAPRLTTPIPVTTFTPFFIIP